MIALRVGERAFFLYCFAKNEQANVSDLQLRASRELAAVYFAYDDRQIEFLLSVRELIEVKHAP